MHWCLSIAINQYASLFSHIILATYFVTSLTIYFFVCGLFVQSLGRGWYFMTLKVLSTLLGVNARFFYSFVMFNLGIIFVHVHN